MTASKCYSLFAAHCLQLWAALPEQCGSDVCLTGSPERQKPQKMTGLRITSSHSVSLSFVSLAGASIQSKSSPRLHWKHQTTSETRGGCFAFTEWMKRKVWYCWDRVVWVHQLNICVPQEELNICDRGPCNRMARVIGKILSTFLIFLISWPASIFVSHLYL